MNSVLPAGRGWHSPEGEAGKARLKLHPNNSSCGHQMAGQGHTGLLGQALPGDQEAHFPPRAPMSPPLGKGAAESTAAVEAKAVALI